MNVMPITELIDKVTEICKANGVKRLESNLGLLQQGLQPIQVTLICCIQMQVDGL